MRLEMNVTHVKGNKANMLEGILSKNVQANKSESANRTALNAVYIESQTSNPLIFCTYIK